MQKRGAFLRPFFWVASMAQRTGSGWARLFDKSCEPLPVLIVFLLLLFVTGGSSWPYENQLIVLRPAAILVGAWGLATMRVQDWREYRFLWAIFGVTAGLTAGQLVPLPFTWWSQLPGREIIAQADLAAGFNQISRPLSMHPEATMNALLSLTAPLAVLSMSAQLDEIAHRRVAGILMSFIAISAMIGLFQLSGSHFSIYETVTNIRPSGLFNNRNHQGAFLAMVFPLAILAWKGGYQSGASVRLERISATSLGVLILPLAIVTGSRSGLLLACTAFALALIEAPWKPTGRANRKAAAVKAGALLGGLVLLVWLTVVSGRDEAVYRLAGAAQDSRFPLWSSVLDAIPTYMPWGTGVGAFADAYQIHEPDALLRPTYSNHAHNEWLEIAFTAGIPGLLILTFAAIAVIAGGIRAWRARGEAAVLPRAGFILILILALASTSDYPVRTPIMSGILALAAVWLSKDFGSVRRAKIEA